MPQCLMCLHHEYPMTILLKIVPGGMPPDPPRFGMLCALHNMGMHFIILAPPLLKCSYAPVSKCVKLV